MRLAAEQGIDPALLHRVAVIGAGTLDSLPLCGRLSSVPEPITATRCISAGSMPASAARRI